MKGCCLECPGWVPVVLLQFTCLRFFMVYLYEALITNFLCRHASSSEASLYHFRADCGLVMVSELYPCTHFTPAHITAHLQSHWAQKGRETPTPVCASDLVSWAGTLLFTSKLKDVSWHEPLLPTLLGVFIRLLGTAQTHYSWMYLLLLPFSPHFLKVADRHFFCSQAIHDCIQLYWTCPEFWEHSLIWMEDTMYHQCSHHLLVVMYPKTPWRPIILCLLF